MNSRTDDTRTFRRILLALDSSQPSAATLEEAVRLARRLNAELTALFVEDVTLLNLAQSPFARHFNLLTRAVETVDTSLMEARLQAQARERRLAVEAAAARAGVRWSFRTVRGRIADAVIAAAADQDLLLVGWTTRSTDPDYLVRVRRPRGAPSTVRAIAIGAQRPVMMLRDGNILGRPVSVVFDGSAGAQRSLIVAAAVAGIAREKLVVLIAGEDALAERAAAILKDTPVREVEYRVLPAMSVRAICEARAQAGAGIVVLDTENPLLASGNGSPLAAFPCPVLLTR
jgi:nucleotide-binding universal stress UspA family protein